MSTSQWSTSKRPNALAGFRGQPGATAYVTGMMKLGSTPSCLLIRGPTGCGKTTLGRIVAALLSGWKGNPDVNPDLVELAANVDRSIEDVRNAIQRAKYSPQGGKRRVMLVDEVQGLVGPAAGAMLKATEDPPKRTTWILCTNEPWKLNKTLIDRCEIITLDLVAEESLVTIMASILASERATFGPKQDVILKRIAAAAHGTPRVAVQMLAHMHKCIVGGGKVSEALRSAIQSGSAGAEGLDSAIAYVQALIRSNETAAVAAVAGCSSPDGIIELVNQVLAALIRVASGSNPGTGLGWVVSKRIKVSQADLSRLLVMQVKLIAALDHHSRHFMPAESLLYGLARQ